MNKYEVKAWAKSKNKRWWILTGIIGLFFIIGIVAGLVAMYMSGYTLWTWLQQFGWLLFILAAVITLIVIMVLYFKVRKN